MALDQEDAVACVMRYKGIGGVLYCASGKDDRDGTSLG